MVVFTCGHCGESVQKPKVEKHYLTKCRNRNPNLSCMDCFKDFFGKDYESHIKCITEEERYSGKGFTAKEKKGEKKQTAWVEILQSVLDEQINAPNNVRKIIENISKHTNTPRKKPKFINFVKNVCGHKTNPKDIDQAWDLISVKLSELSNVTNQNGNQNKKKDSVTSKDADQTNTDLDESKTNESTVENGTEETEAANVDENSENVEVVNLSDKKLTKKQRKEEKKRQKYAAELQSAEAPPAEDEEETLAPSKKGKKKKNRTESENNSEVAVEAESKKQKKRKRQDTVAENGVAEVVDNATENIENIPVNKEKTVKKKPKVDEQLDDSVCLHDQNVARNEEIEEVAKTDKFDWHEAIMSALQKKGDEMPFKRLQKKVLMEYSETTGREIDDRIADKFIKKLKSAPKVRVDKNRVYIEE